MITKTKSFIQIISTPAIITDEDFKFHEFNSAAQNLFALSEQTLEGSLINFINCKEEDLSLLAQHQIAKIENVKLLNAGHLLSQRTFTLKGIKTNISEQHDGYVFILEENPEERIQQLEKERDFYKELLDNMPADVGVFNEEQKYLYVNPHAVKDPAMRQWIIGKDDFDYCEARNIPTNIAKDRREKFKDFLKNKSTYYSFEETSERNNIASHNLRIVRIL